MSENRYQKGMEVLRHLVVAEDGNPTGHMDIGRGYKDIAPDLEKIVVEFAFGDIYGREDIDNKQKVIATISSLVAQGLPQIGMHIETGLNVGLTPKEIVGVIMHLIPYVGFPKALSALKVAQEVFREKELLADFT